MVTPSKTPVVTPAALAASTANDPQFRLPAAPSMNPAVPYVFVDDKLVIEATQSRRVLSGPAITRAVAPAAPLMDGTRNWSELAEETGVTDTQVVEMLSMLFMAGVLDDGVQAFDDTPSNRYVARTADATRVNANASSAIERLESGQVAVLANQPLASVLLADLSAHPIRARLVHSLDDVVDTDLLITDLSSFNGVDLTSIAVRLRELGIPVLPVRISGETLAMGPVSWPDFGACISCSSVSHPAVSGFVNETDTALMAAMLSHEVVNLLGRVGQSVTNGSRMIVDLARFSSQQEFVSPDVSCGVCGGAAAGIPQFPAYEYEQSVAFPPHHLNDPRRHQAHYEDASARLTLEFRKFGSGAEAVRLPDLAGNLGELTTTGLSLETLGEILGAAFGVQTHQMAPDKKLPRWAPSGGNLGSPQAYLHSVGVAGVDDGLYAYFAPDHSLYPLKRPPKDGPRLGVQLVLTGELTRVASKYKTFAYRVVGLDAGVSTLHVSLLSRLYDVSVQVCSHWDEDALDEKFGLNYRDQAITAVLELGQ